MGRVRFLPMPTLRQRVASSRFAQVATFPLRFSMVVRRLATVGRASLRWLVTSREHTNLTYDLTPLNLEHLAWFVALITNSEVSEIRGYIQEVQTDTALIDHVQRVTAASPRRRLADRRVRLASRIGWYALVRATKPMHVVETGTDKGLGSVVLAAALIANGSGRLTTIDINEESGYLVQGRYAAVTDRLIGHSVALIRELTNVDLFLHDSLHTREHELAEYEAATPNLTTNALVVSDNSHVTDALPFWAETTGRKFNFFSEQPKDHWYPGGGIGVAH